jgi:nucleoside-diphosphate-sugar epimerase
MDLKQNQIKILLTGADGYIGGMVYEQLEILRKYAFMNPNLSPDIYVTPLFYLSEESINPFFDTKFDFIFHCAVKGGRHFEIDTSEIYDENIKLFTLIKKLNFKKIIHFTSAADFGRNEDIWEYLPNQVLNSKPNDFFGKAKNQISKEIISNKLGINIRVFNIFGYHKKSSSNFIDLIIDKCMTDQKIIINNNRFFDFFYIENLRPIINKILNSEITVDYNLVHERKYKISEIVFFIRDFLNSQSVIEIVGEGVNYTGKNTFNLRFLDMKDPIFDLKEYINIRSLEI